MARFTCPGDLAVKAYLATRLPATYAAVRDAMAKLAELRSDFRPQSLLDAGSGPGTVLWAAANCWPRLEDALLCWKQRTPSAVGVRR
jgi:ribosomal protein RSM22 (predicted rRNA methylase)